MSTLTKRPAKALYVACSLLQVLLVRLPYWTVKNLLPSWRPRNSWPLSRCIRVNFVKYMSGVDRRLGGISYLPVHTKLETDADGVYVDGVPELISGEIKKWADAANVKTLRIPGYWYFGSGHEAKTIYQPGEKVILYFHGGGYWSLSAHPSSSVSAVIRKILVHSPSIARAFSVEYRLTTPYTPDRSPGEHPFPAQLIDGLSAYVYLIRKHGVPAENVIFVGDSAGANLVLGLTRYLVENTNSVSQLPGPPGGTVLLSPWCDLSGSHAALDDTEYTHARSDFLGPPPAPFSPPSATIPLAGSNGQAVLESPYLSPACKKLKDVSFKGFPETFIVYGGGETLVGSIRTLISRMEKDLGDKLKVIESKDAMHDILGFEWYEPERTEAAIAIGSWMEGLSLA